MGRNIVLWDSFWPKDCCVRWDGEGLCVCLRVNSGTGNLRIESLPPGDCQDSAVNFFSMAFRSADLSQLTTYCWGIEEPEKNWGQVSNTQLMMIALTTKEFRRHCLPDWSTNKSGRKSPTPPNMFCAVWWDVSTGIKFFWSLVPLLVNILQLSQPLNPSPSQWFPENKTCSHAFFVHCFFFN